MSASSGPSCKSAHDLAVAGTRDFFRLAGEHLEASGWQDACPIATVALEVASVNEPMREATRDVFGLWVGDIAGVFSAAGLSDDVARRMAIAVVCALEGAFILARAGRTAEPLEVCGELVATQLAAELGRASSRTSRSIPRCSRA